MEVTVTMPYSEKNRAALDKYEELVKKHYPESEDSKFKESGRGRREFNIGLVEKLAKFSKIC